MIDQHASLSEKFLKKGVWLYLFSFIIAPMGYIIKIIISGELSVSEVGILYGIISLVTLFSSFSDFGIPEALKYYIPKYLKEENYSKIKGVLFYSLLLQIITSVILFSLFFFGSELLSTYYFNNPQAKGVLQVFSLYFIGINIFQIITQFFFALQNTFYLKFCELIRTIFVLGNIIILFSIDIKSIEAISASWIIGLIFGIVCAIIFFFKKYYFVYLHKVPISIEKGYYRQFFKYAVAGFLSAQSASILSQIDMQMVLYFLGTKAAGQYTIYLSLIGIPFILIGPIFPLLYPVISQINDSDKIITIKNNFYKFFGLFGIYLSLILFLFGKRISDTLFGGAFSISGEILQYSCLFLIFNFFLQINYNILSGIGKVRYKLYITSSAIFINIILNYILIHTTLGVYGAALATGITWVYMWGISEILLGYKSFKYTSDIIKYILLSLLLYITFSSDMINNLFIESRLHNFFILLFLGIIILVPYLGVQKEDLKIILNTIKKK